MPDLLEDSLLAPHPSPQQFSMDNMSLYNLHRVYAALRQIEDKPSWQLLDTASFDCMHYLGDSAIAHGAQQLRFTPGAHVLDIGAGFGATGSHLRKHQGMEVTGVETQPEIHVIAEQIAAGSGLSAHVRSPKADFLTRNPAALPRPAQHIISYLCILHNPTRDAVFHQADFFLPPGGKMHIEDFFESGKLMAEEWRDLREVVSCPYLPTMARYMSDLQECYEGSGECIDLDLHELLYYTSTDCYVRRIDAPPHGPHAVL
jgi:SAM-dependent methyltransferase